MSDASRLVRSLREHGVEVTENAAWTAAYSSDASLYRVPPLAVAFPRSHEQAAAAVGACSGLGVPVTARGGGTSVAGNAVGPGLVVDFSRYLNRVLEVDGGSRTAVVQAGVVQSSLQQQVAGLGLRFGPDPSTHTRCTIGGMIGNDACGARSLAYGRTSDNVVGLRLVGADGRTFTTGYDAAGRPQVDGADDLSARLRLLVEKDLAIVRTQFGRFRRHVSGYGLHHLAPERGRDLTRMLVGSEATLALTTEATVTLVPDPAHRALVVVAFDSLASAGDAIPEVLRVAPSACEGLDARIVDVVRRRKGDAAVPPLPEGKAWLLVELSGDDLVEVLLRARDLEKSGLGVSARLIEEPTEADALWRVREDGAGLAGRAPSGRPAHAGWEDAAVPPARLGEYLRGFESLLLEHGLTAMPFGHFGEGCIHVRLDFALEDEHGPDRLRRFVEAASDLVVEFGGSNSGEHGDGRARSELLAKMYSPEALRLMRSVKQVFDPANLLNPGVLVDPASLDVDLRAAAPRAALPPLAMAYSDDDGDLAQAVHRCTGVGKCRADNRSSGGVMCPSYAATKDEVHSTRGRARILQEVVSGSSELTWSSPEVHDALDLCLSCKGCASDCPTGIDIATYKSEVLFQTYRRRLRPVTHYSLGWLPRWVRLASRAPTVANAVMARPALGAMALRLAGVDDRRTMPTLARTPFRRSARLDPDSIEDDRRPVVLFVDTFTDSFRPRTGHAALRLLRDAGYAPQVVRRQGCCGLTLITTGQLDAARRRLSRTIDSLLPFADDGVPIIGLEPSCTAVLRHDAVELLATSAARTVASMTHTLAELLERTQGWTPPDLTGLDVTVQPHCHHHAVMGWDADQRLLEAAGAQVHRVPGCCGMAGNFGVERGHYEISRAVAEQSLLPALQASVGRTATTRIVLADGFSCQTQIEDLAGAEARHLADVLADGVPDGRPIGRAGSQEGRRMRIGGELE